MQIDDKKIRKDVDKMLENLYDNREDLPKDMVVKLIDEHSKEITRIRRENMVGYLMVYAIGMISYFFLSKITFEAIAFAFTLTFLFSYTAFEYIKIRQERRESYQELLGLCKISEGKYGK